jgi:hypothetical protein
MIASEDYQHLLDTKGIPLRELGIRDIALELDDALRAIDFLRKSSVPILGGDVYLLRGNNVELAYSNWHSDPKPGEDHARYLDRSWTTTEEYIKGFPHTLDAKPLFSLVVGG